jgi:erythromycin esterase-like protein
MNAYYTGDFKRIQTEPANSGLTPSGVGLHRWLGTQVYSIAMTAFEGQDGWGRARPVESAPEGSLEWHLHQLGKPYLFIDLRARGPGADSPLHGPLSMRIDQYREDRLTNVGRAFDGIFYIDHVGPATPIGPASR